MMMKRHLSTLSIEYCNSKKLPILDMPIIDEINTKNELEFSSLKEQNKNLAVFVEQMKLKEAELLKKLDNYEDVNSKYIKIVEQLKTCFITLIDNIKLFRKNSLQNNGDDRSCNDNDTCCNDLNNLFQNIENYSADNLVTEINLLDQYVMDIIKDLFVYMYHPTNGMMDSDSSVNNLVSNKELIEKLNRLLNTEACDGSKRRIIEYENQIKSLTVKYTKTRDELKDAQNYMDILRHKIYMMHDRYELKMNELDRKTEELNRKKCELDNTTSELTNICEPVEPSLSSSEAFIDLKNKIDNQNNQYNILQTKYDELQGRYNEVNIEFHNLEKTHKLLTDIPIDIKPEYANMYNKNQSLLDDNNKLREYLEFFWKILIELKNVIKMNVAKFQENISNHINLMIENINEVEDERDSLRNKIFIDSTNQHYYSEQIKHLNENIDHLKSINITLKNQNDYYTEQSKSQRTKILDETKTYCDNDICDINPIPIEVTIDRLKQQNTLIKQLRAEQEAIVSEMELTAQSYEETFDQNTTLLAKLKEKQDSNLKISLDLFKCNQTIQLLTSQSTTIEKFNTYDSSFQLHINNLYTQIEETESLKKLLENSLNSVVFNKNSDPTFDQLKDELNLVKSQLDISNNNINKIIEENSICRIELDRSTQTIIGLRADLDSANDQLSEKLKLLNSLTTGQFNNEHGSLPSSSSFNASNDTILNEQLRIYKSKLTCPCCNSNSMNAILSKCFHLFCYSCLQTRYETRQRKCPRCNTPFGQNDFHKVYF